MSLVFHPVDHKYSWNGIIVPGVTDIIGEWIEVEHFGFDYFVNAFTGQLFAQDDFKDASDTGHAIHKGCSLILAGGLDWDALDESLEAPLKQFVKWFEDFNVKPILAEKSLFSSRYGFAGTPDLICFILKGRLIVCEIKTGDYIMAGPQTAAYKILYHDNYSRRRNPERWVLYLPKDGALYQFKQLTDGSDERFFLYRLSQHQYLKARGF